LVLAEDTAPDYIQLTRYAGPAQDGAGVPIADRRRIQITSPRTHLTMRYVTAVRLARALLLDEPGEVDRMTERQAKTALLNSILLLAADKELLSWVVEEGARQGLDPPKAIIAAVRQAKAAAELEPA
jgi:hypothetical protein